MSDNEYEKFEITDFDLNNEFNPNRSRRPTKNQQIYGIWADENDSDNEEAPSQSRRKKRGKGKGTLSGSNSGGGKSSMDYTAPVAFVAGGIQQSGKKKDPEEKKDEASDDDNSNSPALNEHNTSTESEEEAPKMSNFGMNSMAGFRTANQNSSLPGAKWDQHTKGIGAKLLLQMGYKPGKGLGKDLQGISQPVQAHVRHGRGAIGAYGPEGKQTIGDGKSAKPRIDEDAKETQEFQEKMNQWRKSEKPTKNSKNRYHYKTVQDIIDKSKSKNYILTDRISTKLSNVTVIDMTGPEKRVLSGYHALGQTKAADENLYEHRLTKKCTNFSLPELMHNLQLIVDMCEQEIISIDKTQRTVSKDREKMINEKENLIKIVDLEENHIHTLERASEIVHKLTEPQDPPLTLELAAKLFTELQADFAPEYKEFGLADLAPGIVSPLLCSRLDGWNPLEQPTKNIELLKHWRSILGVFHEDQINAFEPYSALVWGSVMPFIRSAVASWNPRNHAPMAALLDAWAPLLPSWALDNILEQLILPRIIACVEDWDPLTDVIPVHSWILPWTGLLGNKMEERVYTIIRNKLGNALIAWMPQDRSARAMIEPLVCVFPDVDMECFLMKNIVPKLQITLNEMIINPLQQDLEQWNQVWEWNKILPAHIMSQMLEKFFFPKWMQTLVIWLNQSPNLDQVSRWYSGWKGQLSNDLILQQPGIKENFRRGLELMHRSTGMGIANAEQPTKPSVSTSLQQPPALMDLQIIPPLQLEFKEMVSQKCAERGIIFAPMPGRREATGKQVYRVGKLFCYIDRSIVMVSDGSLINWSPISIQVLLERAVTGNLF